MFIVQVPANLFLGWLTIILVLHDSKDITVIYLFMRSIHTTNLKMYFCCLLLTTLVYNDCASHLDFSAQFSGALLDEIFAQPPSVSYVAGMQLIN